MTDEQRAELRRLGALVDEAGLAIARVRVNAGTKAEMDAAEAAHAAALKVVEDYMVSLGFKLAP